MEPRDMPAVLRLCAAQNRRDGTSYPVPLIFDLDKSSPRYGQYLPNVALALVTTVDGRVKQGFFGRSYILVFTKEVHHA